MAGKQSQVETELDLQEISIPQLQGGGKVQGGNAKQPVLKGLCFEALSGVMFSCFLTLVIWLLPALHLHGWVPALVSMPGPLVCLWATVAGTWKRENTLSQRHLARAEQQKCQWEIACAQKMRRRVELKRVVQFAKSKGRRLPVYEPSGYDREGVAFR